MLLGCTHSPAARTSALLGSPSNHPAPHYLQRLFGGVGGCRVFWPGFRHVPSSPQLFFWHGSCWGCQECGWGFLRLPDSSFLLVDDLQMLFCFLKCLYQRNHGERKGTWRDKCYFATYWLPDLPAKRKKLKKIGSLNACIPHSKAARFVLYLKSVVVDIYNQHKHTLTQFLHVYMEKCLRYKYISPSLVVYRSKRVM